MSQIIYIGKKIIQALSWKETGPDGVQVFNYNFAPELSVTANIEDFVYRNPSLLHDEDVTTILVGHQEGYLIPETINGKPLESIKKQLPFYDNKPDVIIETHCSLGLRYLFPVSDTTRRFFERSFHPLNIKYYFEPIIWSWHNILKNNETEGLKIFVDSDGSRTYIAIFNQNNLLIYHDRIDNQDDMSLHSYFLVKTLRNYHQIRMSLFTGRGLDNSNTVEMLLQFPDVQRHDIAINIKSSLAMYLYDMPGLLLPLREEAVRQIENRALKG